MFRYWIEVVDDDGFGYHWRICARTGEIAVVSRRYATRRKARREAKRISKRSTLPDLGGLADSTAYTDRLDAIAGSLRPRSSSAPVMASARASWPELSTLESSTDIRRNMSSAR